MPQSFSELSYIVGTPETVEEMRSVPEMVPFSDRAVTFLNAVSAKLLKTGKAYSDVVTFAFWCRKAALLTEKAKYDTGELRLGRGIAFHSTPSNVPVNCAFSFAAGLLAGNPNIVRLPAKPYAQVDLICAAVKDVLDEQPEMKPYVVFVKFPPVQEIADYFSGICATRIVWGGDMTIAEMRKSPLPPRAKEITFADRHSILVLNAEAVLGAENIDRLAQDFYNDTFFSDQNACTSPRIIVWTGKDKQAAKDKFWSAVHKLVADKYTLAPVQAVGKLAALYRAAAQKKAHIEPHSDNFIYRIKVEVLDADLPDLKYNSGFFFEYDAESLSEIAPVCTNKCQTMTYYGLSKDEIAAFIRSAAPQGIDRAVPMGKSMDFTLIWDGYDLIRELSRIVNV
ncbi:MAG: acyl-CoA reductase [Alphaproteobacteria bacterium]|nr:acyl-CoA reductase [Alphaproteobacteria bacterium]